MRRTRHAFLGKILFVRDKDPFILGRSVCHTCSAHQWREGAAKGAKKSGINTYLQQYTLFYILKNKNKQKQNKIDLQEAIFPKPDLTVYRIALKSKVRRTMVDLLKAEDVGAEPLSIDRHWRMLLLLLQNFRIIRTEKGHKEWVQILRWNRLPLCLQYVP
jgi:hypothetical protein